MSEWSIEHAWKANPATLTERHQNTSSRNQSTTCRLEMLLDVTP
jgi:hypothetical protein